MGILSLKGKKLDRYFKFPSLKRVPYRLFSYCTEPETGPNITQITAFSSTSLKVVWSELTLDDSNGIITEYEICYGIREDPKLNCSLHKTVYGAKTTTVNLSELKKFTTYNVAVRASTKFGFGGLGVVKFNTTRQDSKYMQ